MHQATLTLYILLGSILVSSQIDLTALGEKLSGQSRAPASRPESKNGISNRTFQNDHAAFEAITGESADKDKTVWDSFYKKKSFIYGKDPVGFLKSNIHRIPPGKAFVPAMGEGRNAIYLAKNGFEVEGNDISEVAVDKALAEAKRNQVKIKTNTLDLHNYPYHQRTFDFILVSLFYDPELIPKFNKSLKSGGWIMFYSKVKSPHQTENSPDDFAVNPEDIKAQLKGFDIKISKEYQDQGMTVVGILAKKK